jgi:hypothetical protein
MINSLESHLKDDMIRSKALGLFENISYCVQKCSIDPDIIFINDENLSKWKNIILKSLKIAVCALADQIRNNKQSISADIIVSFYDFILVSNSFIWFD